MVLDMEQVERKSPSYRKSLQREKQRETETNEKKRKEKKKCRWIRSDLPIHFPRKPLKSCTDAEKGRRRHFGCVCVCDICVVPEEEEEG